jgi:hypothetical protein
MEVFNMAEVGVSGKNDAPKLSNNASEFRENLCELCMEVKTLLLNLLSELRAMKRSIEILKKEFWRTNKGGVWFSKESKYSACSQLGFSNPAKI